VKKLFFKLRDVFIRIKVYFTRTSSYVGMLNTTMILFLLLSNLEKYGVDIELQCSAKFLFYKLLWDLYQPDVLLISAKSTLTKW
jgi:hypothetical protein